MKEMMSLPLVIIFFAITIRKKHIEIIVDNIIQEI